MKGGFWDYVRAAFSARPIGMFIPPNWIGLGLCALLGLLNPGFWVVGAGLELAYLFLLANHARFQRVVDATRLARSQGQVRRNLQSLIAQLPPAEQSRYALLERRCRLILEQQQTDGAQAVGAAGLQAQAEGLGRLTYIFLRLLLTRHAIRRVLHESVDVEGGRGTIKDRLGTLREQTKAPNITEELAKSLTGQIDILRQRVEKRREAQNKLEFLEAELSRIEQQVELIREQAVLSTDPDSVSQRIDQIAATLGGTTQWIQEQQQIYGKVEDLMAEPVPIMPASPGATGVAAPAAPSPPRPAKSRDATRESA